MKPSTWILILLVISLIGSVALLAISALELDFRIFVSETTVFGFSAGDFDCWRNCPTGSPSNLFGSTPSVTHESLLFGARVENEEWTYTPNDPLWRYLPAKVRVAPAVRASRLQIHDLRGWAVVWLAANLFFLAMTWSQRTRRPVNPLICAQCGYDLRGGHSKCPECGHSIAKDA